MFATARKEFTETLHKFPIIISLSWDEIKVRYIRSILGPFWIVLTTGISTVGLGYIWSILVHQDKATFIPALCVGLVIWQFLSNCVIDAADCFVTNRALLLNTLNPILIYPFCTIGKNLIIFAHNCVTILFIFLIYPPEVNASTLMLIPGLLLVLGNLLWIVFVLSILGTRYRDLPPAITSFMTIFFFLSPVMYKPAQLGLKAKLLWVNPFTYMISLIRDPLTGSASPWFAYVVAIVALILGWGLLILMLNRYRYRVLYWI